jgi:squalene-hopene/tetraprenyl-beta-curcumene cyclase
LDTTLQTATQRLLSERNSGGYWDGELATSSLSTATAVSALAITDADAHSALIDGGIEWLSEHQNEDGGWGDTDRSVSNISTTLLVKAAIHLAGRADSLSDQLESADGYIQRTGGIPAMVARYGKDRTFSVPILTNCALAGLAEWRDVSTLPFELSCLPHSFFHLLNLPVVSYALPALIAIGQARYFHRPPIFPVTRFIRALAKKKSLRVLDSIQPESGGFLEAIPLTSFVTMSLASIGQREHPVAKKGIEFLLNSVRPDGSWPIDVNLSVWVTTLAINALTSADMELSEHLGDDEIRTLKSWLLAQQYKEIHPYTKAAPGGWSWTHLPGGVPDADDTPGALLALRNLPMDENSEQAASDGVQWLLDLQNKDGGWPTFCRGWGHLPFDRSGSDLTAHCIRAIQAWREDIPLSARGIDDSLNRGAQYLQKQQDSEGYWLPLWFGNQNAPGDINPVYGTARVLAAFHDSRLEAYSTNRKGAKSRQVVRAIEWLHSQQNPDGGWGGIAGAPSTIEETSLAVDALIPAPGNTHRPAVVSGIKWLCKAIADGRLDEPAPIGFYFAKLWYYEKLYPIIFSVAALTRARKTDWLDEACKKDSTSSSVP